MQNRFKVWSKMLVIIVATDVFLLFVRSVIIILLTLVQTCLIDVSDFCAFPFDMLLYVCPWRAAKQITHFKNVYNIYNVCIDLIYKISQKVANNFCCF